jgi:hypothetical protein
MERARHPLPEGKPSNWWAYDREPWRRVSAEIRADDERRAARFRAHAAALSASACMDDVAMTDGAEAAVATDWE